MPSPSIALMIYGDRSSHRNALTEEKYKELAAAFSSAGCNVSSVLYHDDVAENLSGDLLKYDAVLVWVNPIEQGRDRKKLDALLLKISNSGCYVSAHPDVILKMGTKDVLYKTRDMGWGSSINLYEDPDDFEKRFPGILETFKIRVLKQFRGNGGNGVYKVVLRNDGYVNLVHAIKGNEEKTISLAELFETFRPFISKDGLLIDQQWNENCVNGMVRCYMSGTKVSGFGYQEVNALYEMINDGSKTWLPPGKRYYFTENCGLFSDLRRMMETSWIPELQYRLSIGDSDLPAIWDADFFINRSNSTEAEGKYTLCEINVSSVSPFPPSAIPFIVQNVMEAIRVFNR